MTTPAHCTRTDPHPAHPKTWLPDAPPSVICPGVEPPADVAATPDPRLDVVAGVLRDAMGDAADDPDDFALTQRILDALDAMRPDEHIPAGTRDPRLDGRELAFEVYTNAAPAQTMHEPDAMCLQQFPDRPWLACRARLGHDGPCLWTPERPSSPPPTPPPSGRRSAPAGLTPQEIRLRIAEAFDDLDPDLPMLGRLATWVEHGGDETPDGYRTALEDAVARAEARADLAEARLGHIADALRDFDDGTLGHAGDFIAAVLDALAWTPDDTAPAGAATGDRDGD